MKKNTLKEVPFTVQTDRWVDGQGYVKGEFPKMMEYVGGYEREPVEWRPNVPFTAEMKIDRLERGRSAARFWFEDDTGTQYPMFGQGLTEMLTKTKVLFGVVSATWIAVKRGANYGIEVYDG